MKLFERRSNYILFIFLGVIDTSLHWDNIKFFETQQLRIVYFLGVIDTSLQWDNIKFFETQQNSANFNTSLHSILININIIS